jgi:hemerythrin-like domain-containing protein
MQLKLGELSALVAQLEHKDPDVEMRSAADSIVRFFSTVARAHHEDEERHVFPPLVNSTNTALVHAVLRLQQDHGWLEEDWMEIAPHLQAIAGGHAGWDIDALRAGTHVFTELYRDHIELEESFIYPEARVQMNADSRRAMGREMATRHRAERDARRRA